MGKKFVPWQGVQWADVAAYPVHFVEWECWPWSYILIFSVVASSGLFPAWWAEQLNRSWSIVHKALRGIGAGPATLNWPENNSWQRAPFWSARREERCLTKFLLEVKRNLKGVIFWGRPRHQWAEAWSSSNSLYLWNSVGSAKLLKCRIIRILQTMAKEMQTRLKWLQTASSLPSPSCFLKLVPAFLHH